MGYALFTPPSGQSLPDILPYTDAVHGTPHFKSAYIEFFILPSISSIKILETDQAPRSFSAGSGVTVNFDLSNIEVVQKSEPFDIPSMLYYKSTPPDYRNPATSKPAPKSLSDFGSLSWLETHVYNETWHAFQVDSVRDNNGKGMTTSGIVFGFKYSIIITEGKMDIILNPNLNMVCLGATTFPANAEYFITPTHSHVKIANRYIFM